MSVWHTKEAANAGQKILFLILVEKQSQKSFLKTLLIIFANSKKLINVCKIKNEFWD